MPRMTPTARPKKEEAPASAPANRGARLGKGARRDVLWALRQRPRDDVKEITLHGVTIKYVATNDARDDRRVGKTAEKQPPAEKPPKKNSRQRRSALRAKKYFEAKFPSKKASDDQTPDLMERAKATGSYPPMPRPAPRAAPSAAPAISPGDAQTSGRSACANDDAMQIDNDASQSGGDRRSGGGRGGSQRAA